MSDCIFCQIVAGKSPAALIYEDEHTVAFMDIFPANRGHCLVVPRVHVRNIFDASPDVAGHVMAAAARIAPALRTATSAAGMNLWLSNEQPAGQVVFHLHLHMLPRYVGDGIRLPGNRGSANAHELSVLAANIRQQIS